MRLLRNTFTPMRSHEEDGSMPMTLSAVLRGRHYNAPSASIQFAGDAPRSVGAAPISPPHLLKFKGRRNVLRATDDNVFGKTDDHTACTYFLCRPCLGFAVAQVLAHFMGRGRPHRGASSAWSLDHRANQYAEAAVSAPTLCKKKREFHTSKPQEIKRESPRLTFKLSQRRSAAICLTPC